MVPNVEFGQESYFGPNVVYCSTFSPQLMFNLLSAAEGKFIFIF
jgi:hypothetical protein